ncbi:MAG: AzlD domain-containing protein [Comamonas sp.]
MSGANLWLWIVLAALVAWGTKLLGYQLPARWLHSPRMARMAGALTVALLAALTALNTMVDGQRVVADARLAALAAAALALWLRLPFLAVVVIGAAAAAAVRWW